MKVRKNDKVIVITGKDKGKSGKVLRVHPKLGKVVVEGVNIVTKHVRPRNSNEKGQKAFFPAKLDVSKVMVLCPKCGKATRVGYRKTESAKQKNERICKKCHQAFTA